MTFICTWRRARPQMPRALQSWVLGATEFTVIRKCNRDLVVVDVGQEQGGMLVTYLSSLLFPFVPTSF